MDASNLMDGARIVPVVVIPVPHKLGFAGVSAVIVIVYGCVESDYGIILRHYTEVGEGDAVFDRIGGTSHGHRGLPG